MDATTPDAPLLPPVLLGKKVVVLGAGKVGTAVGALLRRAGLPVVAVTTRSLGTAVAAAATTGGEPGTDNAAAAARGDVIIVTTNDDAIGPVVADVASKGVLHPGQLVVHMSGALPLSVLEPAARAGAATGSAHPMQSFATVDDALRLIGGSVFGVTADSGAADTLNALVSVLGGTAVPVDDSCKTLYHAAAVMASNYLVAVEDAAVNLLVTTGFDEASALAALQPLMSGTVHNIGAHGTTAALTGPIVRGDIETVRGHLDALRGVPGDAIALYRALGRRTVEIARRRGTLSPETVDVLLGILAEEPLG